MQEWPHCAAPHGEHEPWLPARLNASKSDRLDWSPPAPVFERVTILLDDFGEHFM